tara:strand:+ start:453 stop:956 length:504 start_codon:yes stop_codon:yes gene_type:complete
MMRVILVFFLTSFLLPHDVVQNIDIKKFMGKWYVISLVPNFVEKGCTNSSDTYTLNDDGTIDIKYYAIKDGKERSIKQKGFVNDLDPGRWDIQFLKPYIPFYRAPYEVIVLDPNYKYMVVGYPDNSFGWVFSRETTLDDNVYRKILDQLEKEFGYEKEKFEKVIHDK